MREFREAVELSVTLMHPDAVGRLDLQTIGSHAKPGNKGQDVCAVRIKILGARRMYEGLQPPFTCNIQKTCFGKLELEGEKASTL